MGVPSELDPSFAASRFGALNASRRLGSSRRSRRPIVMIFLLAAIPLAFSGCGAPTDPLTTAIGATTKTLEQTAGFNLTVSRSSAPVPSRGDVFGRGASRFAAGLTYEAMDLRGVANRTPYTMYLLFLPDRVLLKPDPAPAGLLPRGKLWIEVGSRGQGSLTADDPELMAQLEGLTPELALREIEWGAVKASFEGEPVVRHVPLAKYGVTVNLAKSLAAARKAGDEVLAAAIAAEISGLRLRGGDARAPFVHTTIWIDGPGYVAQLKTAVPSARLGTTSFSLYGFGLSVPRSVPSPAEIVSFGALRRSGKAPASPWDLVRS
jgi:hypothetical protein